LSPGGTATSVADARGLLYHISTVTKMEATL
jgi:hypothetical protein